MAGDSPAEHEDGAGRGVVGQREGLLQTELLAAAVEAIRAVDAFGVVVAAGAVLHGAEVLGALQQEGTRRGHHGSPRAPGPQPGGCPQPTQEPEGSRRGKNRIPILTPEKDGAPVAAKLHSRTCLCLAQDEAWSQPGVSPVTCSAACRRNPLLSLSAPLGHRGALCNPKKHLSAWERQWLIPTSQRMRPQHHPQNYLAASHGITQLWRGLVWGGGRTGKARSTAPGTWNVFRQLKEVC